MIDTRDEEAILAHREAIVLEEMKKRLLYKGPSTGLMGASTSAALEDGNLFPAADSVVTGGGVHSFFPRGGWSHGMGESASSDPSTSAPGPHMQRVNANMSGAAVDGFLIRYLRDKHLSVAEAIAKLKRRRMFERTLPTISMTPAIVTALRSGALQLIGKDYRNRWVLLLNLEDYNVPALEQDDAQRLLIVLLEFMQTQCMLLAEENEQLRQQRQPHHHPGAAAARAEESGEEAAELKRTPRPYQQQFVVVVNEENANFRSHLPLLKNMDTLYTMFAKYYPELVDLILVVGASFEIRQGIKSALACSPQAARKMVLLQKEDLRQYMDPAILPAALGGSSMPAGGDRRKKSVRHRAGHSGGAASEAAASLLYASTGAQFSEVVLRHWYTVTAYLHQEMSSSLLADVAAAPERGGEAAPAKERPLYVPPPFLVPMQALVLWQRALFCSHSVAMHHYFPFMHIASTAAGIDSVNKGMHTALSLENSRQASTTVSPTAPREARGVAAAPHVTVVDGAALRKAPTGGDLGTLTMEGICSALSESDVDVMSCISDENNSFMAAPVKRAESSFNRRHRVVPVSSFTGLPGGGDSKTLLATAAAAPVTAEEIAQIQSDTQVAVRLIERERRKRAEAEKKLLFLQLGITLDPKTTSKVERQLAAIHQELNALVANVVVRAKAAAPSAAGGEAALSQYMDLTISALEASIGAPESVPAWAFSTPAHRDEPPDSCCSTM
ncbi:hypothetical protein STCU_09070 [Strigomonas culicis]|uniref:CRAL-TRIO domain-containing protein n=1 Tax=Strigomonas culicis TaxID=28005 RepID=S9TUP3_9TRYP|nr:hypothetical protein STCU_09070 [Strigomonas culicis]|eukprot:EPY20278.1 hypothetical protein STCU_09070 [Strigomonas culicis]